MLTCTRCTSGRNHKINARLIKSARNITQLKDVYWVRTSRRLETLLRLNAKKHAPRTLDAWELSSSKRVIDNGLVVLTEKEIAYSTVAQISNGHIVMQATIRCTSGNKVDSLNAHRTTLRILILLKARQ